MKNLYVAAITYTCQENKYRQPIRLESTVGYRHLFSMIEKNIKEDLEDGIATVTIWTEKNDTDNFTPSHLGSSS